MTIKKGFFVQINDDNLLAIRRMNNSILGCWDTERTKTGRKERERKREEKEVRKGGRLIGW